MLMVCNHLGTGHFKERTTRCRERPLDSQMTAAWQRVQRHALEEAARVVKARRGSNLTGVQSLTRLLKLEGPSDYSRNTRRKVHCDLVASKVEEPAYASFVDMLSVLPPEDA